MKIELSKVKRYSEQLRHKKHEFSNFIHLISGYLQTGNYEAAKSILLKNEVENDIIKVFSRYVNDPTILSVIIGKYYYAREKNIEIVVDENTSINERYSGTIS